ncbi:unnamed protein product, partial [Scytosiphon promiscuus]
MSRAAVNNNSACNYDGGDCCECDCVDSNYTCGIVDYACIDPASTCQYHHYYDDDGGGNHLGVWLGSRDDAGSASAVARCVDRSSTNVPSFSVLPRLNSFFPTPSIHDSAPVGIIVGGAAGGAVFLGALVVLACCLKTGRLKGSKCCSSSTPAAAAVPPAAEGPSPTMVEAEQGAASSSDATEPAAARPPPHPPSPPPMYEENPSYAATDASAYPGTTAPL